MSILPITIYGDKILTKKVEKVKEIDFKTVELIKNMFDTMKNSNGIGLAANQVGVNKAIFVVDISEIKDYENYKPMVVINPEIVSRSKEKVKMEEGCLSIPSIRAEIERPKSIVFKYQDSDLKEHQIEVDELLARVLQHEYDHLQGILFTNYFDEKLMQKFKDQLNKIKNREIEVDYPVTKVQR